MFELLHPAGICISCHLTEAKLLAVLPDAPSARQDTGAGWVWYRLPPFPDDDVIVGVALGFNQGILALASFTDTHPRYGTNWDQQTEQQERARASSIAAWLDRHGAPAGAHVWGEVSTGIDGRSGFGSAWVRLVIS